MQDDYTLGDDHQAQQDEQRAEELLTPPTLTEKQWDALLQDWNVPREIKRQYWGILSHHIQLTRIQHFEELAIHELQIENVIRQAQWDDSIPPLSINDQAQIMFFVSTWLKKSYTHGGATDTERQSLISQYASISHRREMVESRPPGSGGVLESLRNKFGR